MTGLMIIPPPMPQIAPMIEAEKLMIKKQDIHTVGFLIIYFNLNLKNKSYLY